MDKRTNLNNQAMGLDILLLVINDGEDLPNNDLFKHNISHPSICTYESYRQFRSKVFTNLQNRCYCLANYEGSCGKYYIHSRV